MSRNMVFKVAIASIAFVIGVAGVFVWLNRPYLESFEDVDFAKIPVVDYCEMRNNPEKYSGHILRMESDLFSYQHGLFFYNENCSPPGSADYPGDNYRTAVTFYEQNRDQLWESIKPYAFKRDMYARIKAVGRFTYELPKGRSDGIDDRTAFHFKIHSIESTEPKTK